MSKREAIRGIVNKYLLNISSEAKEGKWVRYTWYGTNLGIGAYISHIVKQIETVESDGSITPSEDSISYGKILIFKQLLQIANPICINLFLTLERDAVLYGKEANLLTYDECQVKNIVPILYKRLRQNDSAGKPPIRELTEIIERWQNKHTNKELEKARLIKNIVALTKAEYLTSVNYLSTTSIIGNSLSLIPDILDWVKIIYCHKAFIECSKFIIIYGDTTDFLPLKILIEILGSCENPTATEVISTYKEFLTLIKTNALRDLDTKIKQMAQMAHYKLTDDKYLLTLPEDTIHSKEDKELIENYLIVSVTRKDYKNMDTLVRSKEVTEEQKYLALCVAVFRGYTDAVKLLIINGHLSVNVMNPTKTTLLKLATDKGYDEIVKFLVSFGAKIRYHDVDEMSFYEKVFDNRDTNPKIQKYLLTLYCADIFFKTYTKTYDEIDFSLILIRYLNMCTKHSFRNKLFTEQPEINENTLIPQIFKDELNLLLLEQKNTQTLPCIGEVSFSSEEISTEHL